MRTLIISAVLLAAVCLPLGFGRHQPVSLSRPRDTMRSCSDHRATGWHGQNNRAAQACIA
jgi:hypothetical protein